TVSIRVTPRVDGTVTNRVSVSGTDDPDPSNNTSSEQTTVTPSADVSVTNTGSPDPVHRGHLLTYTVAVTNRGPQLARNTTLVDSLPKQAATRSVSTSQGTCTRDNTVVTCSLGDIAAGATATVTIVVKPTEQGTITSTASATANQPSDPDMTNNSATAETKVTP
ncbi:MAG: DUF11 domain-containing protein, partial [Actinobacteria bacterium]|nr:DUF11 domain-containing protein [Actinomycetota bacterium]